MTKKLNIAKIIYENTVMNTKDKIDTLRVMKYIKEEELTEAPGVLDAEKIQKRWANANDKSISSRDVKLQLKLALKRIKSILKHAKVK